MGVKFTLNGGLTFLGFLCGIFNGFTYIAPWYNTSANIGGVQVTSEFFVNNYQMVSGDTKSVQSYTNFLAADNFKTAEAFALISVFFFLLLLIAQFRPMFCSGKKLGRFDEPRSRMLYTLFGFLISGASIALVVFVDKPMSKTDDAVRLAAGVLCTPGQTPNPCTIFSGSNDSGSTWGPAAAFLLGVHLHRSFFH
eukprot:TRINITY_DN542_c0_g1_i1.p1 TRINITY_DN542_c0_g1~~TRINITY_DN542_c0_g1_i1.p1  ORF type:complete len:195 (-),score=7.48 TRINITY_DN542_c0_g1_i1:223-807(-)